MTLNIPMSSSPLLLLPVHNRRRIIVGDKLRECLRANNVGLVERSGICKQIHNMSLSILWKYISRMISCYTYIWWTKGFHNRQSRGARWNIKMGIDNKVGARYNNNAKWYAWITMNFWYWKTHEASFLLIHDV